MQSEATRPAWRRFHQYFWLIKEYGHAGHEEVRILVFFSQGGILRSCADDGIAILSIALV
jgi:hypothetical protein